MNNQDLFENLSREGIQTTEEQRKISTDASMKC